MVNSLISSPVDRGIVHHPAYQLLETVACMLGEFRNKRCRRHPGLRVDFENDEFLFPAGRVVVAEIGTATAAAAKRLMCNERYLLHAAIDFMRDLSRQDMIGAA